MAQYVAEVHRVVDCGAIKSIAQKWIKVAIEAFRYKLDLSALNRHHERSDTSMSHGINVCVIMFNKLLECFQVARATRKVQRCSP